MAASAGSITDSVMRSASAWSSATGSVTAPVTVQATPRSMRVTAVRPEVWAMSVAFDDHEEIVPSRGTTRRTRTPSSVAGRSNGPPPTSRGP